MSGIKLTPQQQAAMALDRNIAVSASAGSGKTRVLVERYLQILRTFPDLRPANIVAITFTRKAAAEMRERVRDRLIAELELVEGTMTRPKRLRIAGLLDELPRAPISTIHGFAADILREFAIPAGLDPGFGILEDERSDQPGSQAAFLAVRRMETDDPACLRTALHFFDLQTLTAILQDLAGRPGMIEALERQMRNPFDYREFIRSRLGGIDPAGWLRRLNAGPFDATPATRADLDVIREALGSLAAETGPDQARQAVTNLCGALFTKTGAMRKTQNFKSLAGAIEGLQQEMMFLKDIVSVSDAGERYAAKSLEALVPLVRMTAAERERLRRQTSLLTFDDLEVLAWLLLTQSKDAAQVRERLRRRYRFFMIDEFQDTNPIQWKLIRPLVSDEGGRLLPDRLFVVGDPKQSIYGFRNADVRVFREVGDTIAVGRKRHAAGDPGGLKIAASGTGGGGDSRDIPVSGSETLRIDWNFRSRKAILQFVDLVCRPVMTGGGDFEVDYEPLTPARDTAKDRPDDPGKVGIILSNPCPKTDGDTENDAPAGTDSGNWVDLLAGHILQTVRNDHFHWQDIAVMFPRRKRLDAIKRTFRLQNIPFVVYKGTGFWQQPEIRDLTALITWMADPGNRTALYTVLRSAFFNVSDAGLLLLANRWPEFPSEPAGRPGADTPAGATPDVSGIADNERTTIPFDWPDNRSIRDARRILPAVRDAVGVKPLARILEEFLERTGGWGSFSVEDDSGQIIGNLEKFLDIVTGLDREGVAPLWETAQFLAMKEREGEKEDEALMADAAGDTVKLMTVHAAKGLEFPVVYVIDLEQMPNSDRSLLIADPERGAGLRLGALNPDMSGYETMLYRELKQVRKQRETAERKRLMYVVFTRAMDRLYLVHRPSKRADILKPSIDGNRWLDWVGCALNLSESDIAAGRKIMTTENGGTLAIDCITDVTVPEGRTREYPSLEEVRQMLERTGTGAAGTQWTEAGKAEAASEQQREGAGYMAEKLEGNATLEPDMPFAVAVTTIRDYLADREDYIKKHVLHMVDRFRDPGADPVRETARIFGDAFHRLMERHPGLEPEAVDAAIDAMLPELSLLNDADRAVLTERFRRTVEQTRLWPLWGALQKDQGFHELPFNIYLPGGIVHGIIDLLIRIDGRWHVVDYKTDRKPERIGTEDWLAGHRGEHRFQMSVYALAVRRMNPENREPVPVIVYFADTGSDIRFEFASDELDRLENDLDRTLGEMARTGQGRD